jgi:hypothetical protein
MIGFIMGQLFGATCFSRWGCFTFTSKLVWSCFACLLGSKEVFRLASQDDIKKFLKKCQFCSIVHFPDPPLKGAKKDVGDEDAGDSETGSIFSVSSSPERPKKKSRRKKSRQVSPKKKKKPPKYFPFLHHISGPRPHLRRSLSKRRLKPNKKR